MENRIVIVIISLIILTAVRCPSDRALAYDDKTAHPALTQEVVKFFNDSFSDTHISEPDAENIIQGSKDEDADPRYLNHFYDPIYKRGFKGTFLTSKEWATNTLVQAAWSGGWTAIASEVTKPYYSSPTDFTWDRAVYEYVHGDKRRALLSLGHILHLLEDATVPEHTRNDLHLPFGDMGSPYETWTAKFVRTNITTASDLEKENAEPTIYGSVPEYFDREAMDTNTNFFSRGTMNGSEYVKPVISGYTDIKLDDDRSFLVATSESGQELVKVDRKRDIKSGKIIESYTLLDPTNLVLTSYWSHLSREAVKNGAGLVKLFFDDVEKEKKSGKLLARNTSLLKKILNNTGTKLASVYSVLVRDRETGVVSEVKGEREKVKGVEITKEVQKLEDSGIAKSDIVVVKTADNDSLARAALLAELNSLSNKARSLQEALQLLASSAKCKKQNAKSNETTCEEVLPTTKKDDVTVPVLDLEASTTRNMLVYLKSAGGGGAGGVPYTANNTGPSSPPPEDGSVDDDPTPPPDDEPDAPPLDTTAPESPVITSPSPLSQTFAATSITFSGTAEVSSTVAQTLSTATTTATNGNWSFALVFPVGTSTISFTAKDAAGNVSNPKTATIYVELPPAPLNAPIVAISDCTESLATDTCLLLPKERAITWTSAGTGAHYSIKVGDTEIGTTDLLTMNHTFTEGDCSVTVTATRGAESLAGNTLALSVKEKPFLISEIEWMGNFELPNDEWIELKNNTTYTLDATKFRIENTRNEKVFLTGTVSPDAYYLMEHGDDDVITDIPADIVYQDFSLNNVYDYIFITVGGNMIEITPRSHEVGCFNELDNPSADHSTGWCAGNIPDAASMERKSLILRAEGSDNWISNGGVYVNGRDRNGGEVFGTPKQPYIYREPPVRE